VRCQFDQFAKILSGQAVLVSPLALSGGKSRRINLSQAAHDVAQASLPARLLHRQGWRCHEGGAIRL
jgi:hypothetical protein